MNKKHYIVTPDLI